MSANRSPRATRDKNGRMHGRSGQFLKADPTQPPAPSAPPTALLMPDSLNPAVLQPERPKPSDGRLGEVLGYAGRRVRTASLIYDDPLLQELRGPQARQTLARMALDGLIGGIVERVGLAMRSAPWTVRPGGEADADKQFADRVQEDLDHLEGGFQGLVGAAASELVWGFFLAEVVFQRHPDGHYGWAAFWPRDQWTVWDWFVDPHTGRLLAVYQLTQDGFRATLPAWKLLHFRTVPMAGRPEGVSLLRNAFLPWTDKQEFRRILKVGLRRDLVGTPKVTVPAELLSDAATPEQQALLQHVITMVEEVEQDLRMGIVFPSGKDEQGRDTGWDLDLIKSPGARQLKLEDLWGLYNREIAIALISEVVLVGTERTGSYALADVKTSSLNKAVSTWMDDIAEVMRTRACVTLRDLNPGWAKAELPIFSHGPLDPLALKDLGDFIQKTMTVGAITPDEGLERELRERADLPPKVAEEGTEAVTVDTQSAETGEDGQPPIGPGATATQRKPARRPGAPQRGGAPTAGEGQEL